MFGSDIDGPEAEVTEGNELNEGTAGGRRTDPGARRSGADELASLGATPLGVGAGSEAEVRALIERLGAVEVDGVADALGGGLLVALVELTERAQAALVSAVEVWDGTAVWKADGALSPASWLASRTELSKPAARRIVRTARACRRHRELGDALESGSVTTEAAETLAATPNAHTAELFERDLEVLLECARSLGVDDLRAALRRWRLIAEDTADGPAPHNHVRPYLTTSVTLDGSVRGDFCLSGPGGGQLLSALEMAVCPDPAGMPGGPRSNSELRADALVDLAELFLRTGGNPGADPNRAGGPYGRVDATIDVATLCGIGFSRGLRPAGLDTGGINATGPDSANPPGPIGVHGPSLAQAALPPSAGLFPGVDGLSLDVAGLMGRRCDLDHVGPVAPEAIRRLACDNPVARLVFDGPDKIIGYGTDRRLFSPAQRRAIALRDRGCVFPGCDRPPGWCDVHHIRHHESGGTTDVDNGALLCRRHHTLVHEKRWRIERDSSSGQIIFTSPRGDRLVEPSPATRVLVDDP